MPLYEFECPKCGRRDEVVREMDERNNEVLCTCGAQMKRVLSQPLIGKESFQFQLKDSKGQVVATGRGGSKKGRWYRP